MVDAHLAQSNMGYLSHADFQAKYLDEGQQTNQHFAHLDISDAQFAADISWLFGALSSILRDNVMPYVQLYKRTQDGLALWMYFLDIYEDSGDKTTEIGKHEVTINKDLITFTGPFVDFVNQNEKAYNALAALGQQYDYDARLSSITRRMQCMHERYGWMLVHIESNKLTYPEAITFMRKQGIRQDTASAASALRQAQLGHTETTANDGRTDVDDNRHGTGQYLHCST
jgi:hypothetical protein